jgi:serine/threonine protein phosphatase PrpC
MLAVDDYYTGTDTGRQRRANEDSLFARAPLFVVADGMGGAQAGEVASRIAVEAFQPGLPDAAHPEQELAELARSANERIHSLSHSNAEQAGMGTTLTALYVGEHEVAIAHVGDSRAYCLRDRKLLRLTDDHTLVDELMRQGRLTPEEAVEHPQRSVITRALGPEGAVDVDTRSFQARAGDVYLLCSDGLTTMLSEQDIAAILNSRPQLRDAGEALIKAANDAGGRDNVTVVLLRLKEVGVPAPDGGGDGDTMIGMPAVTATSDTAAHEQEVPDPADGQDNDAAGAGPAGERGAAAFAAGGGAGGAGAGTAVAQQAPARRRLPRVPGPSRERRRRRRGPGFGALLFTLIVLGLLAAGAYIAWQNVYFIGTNSTGLVTLYQGIPYQLPGGVNLYSAKYTSGVGASTIPPARRKTLLNHHLHSEGDAASLIRSLELGQLEGGG